MKYENAAEAEVSKKFTEVEVETFEGWTAFSNLSEKDDKPNFDPSSEDVILNKS